MKVTLNDLITISSSTKPDRRQFVGGSDARIIMSPDEAALIRLWREKRGEAEPQDLSNGRSRKTRRPKNTWRNCSTTCG
jgi:predicted phage-related endonuclease